MAIAFDATAKEGYKVFASNPETYSHTCSGSNRILFVGTSVVRTGLPTVTVTYNGTSMSQHPDSPQAPQSNIRINAFYLIAPDTGTNTVSMSYSDNPTEVGGVSVSYTGVAQTGTFEDTDYSIYATNVTAASVSLTSVTDNAWFIGQGTMDSGNISPGSGETERNDEVIITMQDFIQATAGTASLDWSTPSADKAVVFGYVIKEATSGGTTPYRRRTSLPLLGVG